MFANWCAVISIDGIWYISHDVQTNWKIEWIESNNSFMNKCRTVQALAIITQQNCSTKGCCDGQFWVCLAFKIFRLRPNICLLSCNWFVFCMSRRHTTYERHNICVTTIFATGINVAHHMGYLSTEMQSIYCVLIVCFLFTYKHDIICFVLWLTMTSHIQSISEMLPAKKK